MPDRAIPAWEKWLFRLSVAALAVSGFAQMPIFKRYYIADVPGLGWTADFYFTHKMHYVAAAVFLFVLAWRLGRWWAARRGGLRPAAYGWFGGGVLGLLLLTGYLRAAKNLDDVFFGIWTTRLVDWLHLVVALAFLLLLAVNRRRARRS